MQNKFKDSLIEESKKNNRGKEIYNKFSIKTLFCQFLRVDVIRYFISLFRFIFLGLILRKLKTINPDNEKIGVNALHHNLTRLKNYHGISVNRSHLLIRPLSVLTSLNPASKILSIGPRSEGELFNLLSVGFKKKNIRGLDLISYSSWIDLGDMHDMPYEDHCWDAAILGWCLAYSNDRPKVASEVIRVVRPGGVVAVGVEYTPENPDQISQRHGYKVCDEERMSQVKEIHDLFKGHVDQVFFSQDILPSEKNQLGQLLTIFSVK